VPFQSFRPTSFSAFFKLCLASTPSLGRFSWPFESFLSPTSFADPLSPTFFNASLHQPSSLTSSVRSFAALAIPSFLQCLSPTYLSTLAQPLQNPFPPPTSLTDLFPRPSSATSQFGPTCDFLPWLLFLTSVSKLFFDRPSPSPKPPVQSHPPAAARNPSGLGTIFPSLNIETFSWADPLAPPNSSVQFPPPAGCTGCFRTLRRAWGGSQV
jgi:hypothetical protein